MYVCVCLKNSVVCRTQAPGSLWGHGWKCPLPTLQSWVPILTPPRPLSGLREGVVFISAEFAHRAHEGHVVCFHKISAEFLSSHMYERWIFGLLILVPPSFLLRKDSETNRSPFYAAECCRLFQILELPGWPKRFVWGRVHSVRAGGSLGTGGRNPGSTTDLFFPEAKNNDRILETQALPPWGPISGLTFPRSAPLCQQHPKWVICWTHTCFPVNTDPNDLGNPSKLWRACLPS